MTKRAAAATSFLLLLSACAEHKKTEPPPPAPAAAAPAPTVLPDSKTIADEARKFRAMETELSEPIGCALYAGDDRPDNDAQDLKCLVEWMRGAHDYLAHGGKPTKYTNSAAFRKNRRYALQLVNRLAKYAASESWDGKQRNSDEVQKSSNARSNPDHANHDISRDRFQQSQQHYLSGMIYYQKQDYEKARDEWNLAIQLDPKNDDAKTGLDRVEKLYGQ